MTFILQKKEPLDTISTRWIEPVEGLRIKVASAAKEGYKNDYRIIMRHVQALSGQHGIGTEEFSVLKLGDRLLHDQPRPAVCWHCRCACADIPRSDRRIPDCLRIFR